MEIFDLAAKLGQALKKEERLIALEQAKKAYEEDAALRRDMTEYEVQQKVLAEEITKGEGRDLQLVDMVQARIDALYKQINENPAFSALDRAQTAVNDLMARVNAAITYEITGELPGAGCTHDCSTCGGCR
ncbi:MAG: YlbF family regulator [Clostridia bacterium]|nr:YlbF family regulator [Clostridia bacterium]